LFRNIICAFALSLLAGCGAENGRSAQNKHGLPDQSYTLPTAILGIPVRSSNELQQIHSAASAFAGRHGLRRYRAVEVPFFAKLNAEDPLLHLERYTRYGPPNPRMREGFSVQLDEFSAECVLLEVSEYSGIWTRRSLNALMELEKMLADVTQGRSKMLVRPKRVQNWPHQQTLHDPERPTYLAELCVRMGLADPRSPDEIAAQGQFD
jgi:hypothetical protein